MDRDDAGLAPSTIARHVKKPRVLGRRTRVLDIGQGPVIICSSGVASAIPDWLLLLEELVKDFRVIVFDRPSYAPGDNFFSREVSLESEAKRLIGVLDACGVDTPAMAVGHSMGAYIVESAVRRFPHRFASAVYLDGSTLSEADEDRRVSRRRRSVILRRSMRSRVLARAWAALGSKALLAAARGRAKIYSRYSLVPLQYAQQGFLLGTVREFIDFDSCADQLECLRGEVPLPQDLVLGMFPAQGRLSRVKSSRWVGEVFAEARILARECAVLIDVVEPSGHFVMIDQPLTCAQLIRVVYRESRTRELTAATCVQTHGIRQPVRL